MKRIVTILIAAMLLPLAMNAQDLKVISYNIRNSESKDGTNSWAYRYAASAEMIKDQAPDIFGVQEALSYQIYYIEQNFPQYKSVGVGREDGKQEGEFMSIFWNKKTISLLKWGTFWLSETPEKPSMGWDAACYRTATWALMKDKKTGKKFYYVNTHLDHKGKEAQKNGLKLIVDRIEEINPDGYPMVLTGDFNIKPDNANLVELDSKMQSARKIAEKTDNHNTYNGWGKAKADNIIDYIYVSGFSACPEYHTVTEKYADRKFVSDHYPICATVIF